MNNTKIFSCFNFSLIWYSDANRSGSQIRKNLRMLSWCISERILYLLNIWDDDNQAMLSNIPDWQATKMFLTLLYKGGDTECPLPPKVLVSGAFQKVSEGSKWVSMSLGKSWWVLVGFKESKGVSRSLKESKGV